MLDYLVKLNKKVDSLQKEIKDIKKTLQSGRTIGEADDMYNKTFIKVNILFYLFFFTKKKKLFYS